jgi:V8-like Glu-specific endopeptidase
MASAPAFAIVAGTASANFQDVGDLSGASGVLIAPNWVLTAAHVADGVMLNSTQYISALGSSLIDAKYTFDNLAHPSNDIALVHLTNSINGAYPVLNDVRYNTSAKVTALGALTMTSAQNQAPQGYGYTTGKSAMSSYSAGSITSTVNWIVTNGGAKVQPGDSGGGLFLGKVSDSAGAILLGVASASMTTSGGGSMSAFVQTAPYKTWIDTTMASSGQRAVWTTTTVPEASTLALTMLGGVVVFTLAKRKAKRSV